MPSPDTSRHAAPGAGGIQDVGTAGAWSLDLSSWCLSLSPAARRIHEFPDDYCAAAWEILHSIQAADRPGCLSALLHCARASRPFELQVTLNTFRGRSRSVHITGFLATDAAGEPMVLKGTLADLGDAEPATGAAGPRRLLTDAREWELFARALPHELKTPVTVARAHAEALQARIGDAMASPERGWLRQIVHGLVQVDALTDAVLALAPGRDQEVEHRDVDLSGLAAECVQMLRGAEPARDVSVCIQSGVQAPGDAKLLRLVLRNLLENAWKFTRGAASPRVYFLAEARGSEIACCIVDNGLGFESSEASRLFEPFRRLHDARAFPGTGLGLVLVRRIVQWHGGRVWARGMPGAGAEFWFSLPVPRDRNDASGSASHGGRRA